MDDVAGHKSRREAHHHRKEHAHHNQTKGQENKTRDGGSHGRGHLQMGRHDRPNERSMKDIPMNSEKSFVYEWLATTDTARTQPTFSEHPIKVLHNKPSHNLPTGRIDLDTEENSFRTTPRREQFDRPLLDTSTRDLNAVPARKRRRRATSDSSLLDLPPGRSYHHPQRASQEGPGNFDAQTAQACLDDGVTAYLSEDGVRPASKPRKETFEKRARHKTREDRYEPNKATVRRKPEKDDGEAQLSQKETTKSKSRSAKKYSSGELLRKFESDKVAKERLTMPPGHGPGLYKNGRASIPTQRRGVLDLAFSEMDFLRHTSRRQQSTISDQPMSTHNNQGRSHRFTTENDISAYLGERQLSVPRANVDVNYKQLNHTAQKFSVQESPQQLLEHSVPPSIPDHLPKPREVQHMNNPHQEFLRSRNPPASDLEGRGKNSSCVSWSESHYSKEKRIRDTDAAEPERISYSSTPESIRKIIRETGIFRNTCLEGQNENGVAETSVNSALSDDAYSSSRKRAVSKLQDSSTLLHLGGQHSLIPDAVSGSESPKQSYTMETGTLPQTSTQRAGTMVKKDNADSTHAKHTSRENMRSITDHFSHVTNIRQALNDSPRADSIDRQQISRQVRIRPLSAKAMRTPTDIVKANLPETTSQSVICDTDMTARPKVTTPSGPDNAPNMEEHNALKPHQDEDSQKVRDPASDGHGRESESRTLLDLEQITKPKQTSLLVGSELLSEEIDETVDLRQATSDPDLLGLPIRGGFSINSQTHIPTENISRLSRRTSQVNISQNRYQPSRSSGLSYVHNVTYIDEANQPEFREDRIEREDQFALMCDSNVVVEDEQEWNEAYGIECPMREEIDQHEGILDQEESWEYEQRYPAETFESHTQAQSHNRPFSNREFFPPATEDTMSGVQFWQPRWQY